MLSNKAKTVVWSDLENFTEFGSSNRKFLWSKQIFVISAPYLGSYKADFNCAQKLHGLIGINVRDGRS